MRSFPLLWSQIKVNGKFTYTECFAEFQVSAETNFKTDNTAMVNPAHLGLENYPTDTFIEYSNIFFNSEQIY